MTRLARAPQRLRSPGVRLAAPAKTVDPFYESTAWRAFARSIKQQRGWTCEECGKDMSRDPRNLHADHVTERKDGGADFDPLNIRLLCTSHHTAKTTRTRATRPDRWR
jgi:5-methylcytosine-specific restriction endonuclease McrA